MMVRSYSRFIAFSLALAAGALGCSTEDSGPLSGYSKLDELHRIDLTQAKIEDGMISAPIMEMRPNGSYMLASFSANCGGRFAISTGSVFDKDGSFQSSSPATVPTKIENQHVYSTAYSTLSARFCKATSPVVESSSSPVATDVVASERPEARQPSEVPDEATAKVAPSVDPVPVEFAGVELGSAVDDNLRVISPRSIFSPNDTIYAVVSTRGVATRAVLRAKFTFQDGQLVNESDQTINPSGDAQTSFYIRKPDAWPPGQYQVQISLNGDAVASRHFRVAAKSALSETAPNLSPQTNEPQVNEDVETDDPAMDGMGNSGPSFDCTQATTDAEFLICSDENVSRADRLLARTYLSVSRRMANQASLQREQSVWRTNVRDSCEDAACMLGAYEARIAQLRRLEGGHEVQQH